MSDDEVSSLRREIKALSDKTDRQHSENRGNQERDREAFRQALATQQATFAASMAAQRDLFQDAISKQFMLHVELEKKVDKHNMLLEATVGSGQPGEGRLGVLESGMETMKKFRWQALTIVALMMWAIEVWRHGA
jgi:hypothetical protein